MQGINCILEANKSDILTNTLNLTPDCDHDIPRTKKQSKGYKYSIIYKLRCKVKQIIQYANKIHRITMANGSALLSSKYQLAIEGLAAVNVSASFLSD